MGIVILALFVGLPIVSIWVVVGCLLWALWSISKPTPSSKPKPVFPTGSVILAFFAGIFLVFAWLAVWCLAWVSRALRLISKLIPSSKRKLKESQ